MHAQIFPNIWAKAFCLLYDLYVMFNILGLSSHPRFCRLFNWPRKTAIQETPPGNSCVKVSRILKINMFDHVCPFWETFMFDICLARVWYICGTCLMFTAQKFLRPVSSAAPCQQLRASGDRLTYVRTWMHGWMYACMQVCMDVCK